MTSAVSAGGVDLPTDDLAAWQAWANEEADRIDPVKSGQVWKHLKPPVVD